MTGAERCAKVGTDEELLAEKGPIERAVAVDVDEP